MNLLDAEDSNDVAPTATESLNYRFVFIDDFCGTGTQAVRYAGRVVGELRKRSANCQIEYFVLAGTSAGLSHVEKEPALIVLDASLNWIVHSDASRMTHDILMTRILRGDKNPKRSASVLVQPFIPIILWDLKAANCWWLSFTTLQITHFQFFGQKAARPPGTQYSVDIQRVYHQKQMLD